MTKARNSGMMDDPCPKEQYMGRVRQAIQQLVTIVMRATQEASGGCSGGGRQRQEGLMGDRLFQL